MKQLSGATNELKVRALVFEAQSHCPARFNDHRLLARFASKVVPALPGVPEEKTQVVRFAVAFAAFQ